MDKPDTSLFDYKFTNKMDFVSSFDKMKCFRVIDEEGKVETPGYAE